MNQFTAIFFLPPAPSGVVWHRQNGLLGLSALVQKTGRDGILGGAGRGPRGPPVSCAIGMIW
jgi:hypothetical protein